MFDGGEKMAEIHFVDLYNHKKVQVKFHPPRSSKPFQSYFNSVHKKTIFSRPRIKNATFHRDGPVNNYPEPKRASDSNVSSARGSQRTVRKNASISGKR